MIKHVNPSKNSHHLWQIKRKFVLTLCSVTLPFVLSGCTDRVAIANEKMQAIRNAPAQPIEPPPQPEAIEDFVYSAKDMRSPFIAPSAMKTQVEEVENSTGVKPDISRIKEPLEEFELSQLVYRGLVVLPDGTQHGLVQRPDNSITNVQVGEYLGLNNGRIVEITPTQINLIEIIPDSRSGFVEKPQSLISPVS